MQPSFMTDIFTVGWENKRLYASCPVQSTACSCFCNLLSYQDFLGLFFLPSSSSIVTLYRPNSHTLSIMLMLKNGFTEQWGPHLIFTMESGLERQQCPDVAVTMSSPSPTIPAAYLHHTHTSSLLLVNFRSAEISLAFFTDKVLVGLVSRYSIKAN